MGLVLCAALLAGVICVAAGNGHTLTPVFRLAPARMATSSILLAGGSSNKALERFKSSLDIKRYEVDHSWQARGDSYDPWFRWVVGEGIPNGAPVGSSIADFDGDGSDELLVVRWKQQSILLEMYEVRSGKAQKTDSITDYRNEFPVKGVGALDVLVDESKGIDVQWWFGKQAVTEGKQWQLDRYTYDGTKFKLHGKAHLLESEMNQEGVRQLNTLKYQIKSLGLPNKAIPDSNSGDGFLSSLFADVEKSLTVVTRVLATINEDEHFLGLDDIAWHGGEEWTPAHRAGSFIVSQKAEAWPGGTGNGAQGAQPEQSQPEQSMDGPFKLRGRIHYHTEDAAGEMVSVVSITLDEPVPYRAEYKGSVYESVATEVFLGREGMDMYDELQAFRDQQITVGCDELREAYHDASCYKVDAVAVGNVRVAES
ncbi:MAG: hypothetical protein IKG21_11455 [Atopobiaceae bacterium]|nr:hypothetical protein [Atopobiaceae bacterium]